jgi:hypothetical protein
MKYSYRGNLLLTEVDLSEDLQTHGHCRNTTSYTA